MLGTEFVVKYVLNLEGVKEFGCEKLSTRPFIHS